MRTNWKTKQHELLTLTSTGLTRPVKGRSKVAEYRVVTSVGVIDKAPETDIAPAQKLTTLNIPYPYPALEFASCTDPCRCLLPLPD